MDGWMDRSIDRWMDSIRVVRVLCLCRVVFCCVLYSFVPFRFVREGIGSARTTTVAGNCLSRHDKTRHGASTKRRTEEENPAMTDFVSPRRTNPCLVAACVIGCLHTAWFSYRLVRVIRFVHLRSTLRRFGVRSFLIRIISFAFSTLRNETKRTPIQHNPFQYRYHHHQGIGNRHAIPRTKPHGSRIDGHDPRDRRGRKRNHRLPRILDDDGPQDEGHRQRGRNPRSLQGL
mmetsp:Transcript_25520/g.54441  ORF Transcript_25520/g.54441 Transcript_25520/m.54441 type:complete len:231 (+) Transcript_25520:1-693(+)